MNSVRKVQFVVMTVFFSILFISFPAMAGGDAKHGKRLYGQYCVPCHGQLGAGDGDRYKNERLDPQPRIHADGNYMNRLPDMRLFMVIKYGGRFMRFSHIMPQWQHILSDKDIVDVIAHVRTLAYPLYQPPDYRFGGTSFVRGQKKDSS